MHDSSDSFFDLNDYRRQLQDLKRMGSLRDLASRIPGLCAMLQAEGFEMDIEAEIRRIQGVIDSMTPEERADPTRIDACRRRRIALGAGVLPSEVLSLLQQFIQLASVAKRVASMAPAERIRTLAEYFMEDPSTNRTTGNKRARILTEARQLHVEAPMSTEDRATLRRMWEILARNGRLARCEEPWFSNWNRNLRLWNFVADD